MRTSHAAPTRPVESTLSQAEIDHAELDATEVSPKVAKLLSWAFVGVLAIVPLSQAGLELTHRQGIQAMDVFTPFVSGALTAMRGNWHAARRTWASGIEKSALHGYEERLERESWVKNFFQPRVQELLTAYGGFGNDKTIVGRDHWLYYQPGWAYVVGPSMLDPDYMSLRVKKAVDKAEGAIPQPDPRPAILQFNERCKQAGIHLIVLPIPDKVMLQPQQLSLRVGQYTPVPVPNNSGYRALVRDLTAKGVDVLDVAPSAVAAGEVRFLVQDTHWTPSFMESVAGLTAARIAGLVGAAPRPPKFQLVERRVSRVGDLVDMLKLPANQKVFEPQTVTVEEVIDEGTGRPVQASPDSDILLIGDSFTNIYSQADLGWGAGAGFAEHLAYRLDRPVDVIALNGGGAWRGRSELARSENARRLGRKKAIVYEFAIRDFTSEDWRVVPMVNPIAAGDSAEVPQVVQPVKQSASNRATEPKSEHTPTVSSQPEASPTKNIPLIVNGTILKTSKVPAPRTAPYKDCLTFIKIRVDNLVSGTYGDTELVAAFWAMKDNEWLPPASYVVGDKVRLTLMPLNKTEPQIRSMQRADDLDDYTRQPFYVLQEGH